MSNKVKIFGIVLVLMFVGCCFAFAFREEIKTFVKEIFYEETYKIEYSEQVKSASEEFGVPEAMIYAVIKTESNFEPDAVSRVGAVGLMQLMPDTYSWVAMRLDEKEDINLITDVETNIRYGTYYLSFLMERLEEDETVYAAYNAGYTRVTGWLADNRYSADGKKLDNIPYPETESYVKKVKKAREKYEKIILESSVSSRK